MASNIFTGASRYSTDFQSVIDRSVNIASLPMLQMQQNKVKISDESAALKSLDSKLSSLRNHAEEPGQQLRIRFLLHFELGFVDGLSPDLRWRGGRNLYRQSAGHRILCHGFE